MAAGEFMQAAGSGCNLHMWRANNEQAEGQLLSLNYKSNLGHNHNSESDGWDTPWPINLV